MRPCCGGFPAGEPRVCGAERPARAPLPVAPVEKLLGGTLASSLSPRPPRPGADEVPGPGRLASLPFLCVHTLARGSEQGQAGVWAAGVFCVWMGPGDLMTWPRVSGSAGRRFHGEPRRPGPSGLGLVCVMNVGGSSSHRNYLKGFRKRENKFNQTITVVPPSGAECIFRNVGLVQSLPVFMCYHSN